MLLTHNTKIKSITTKIASKCQHLSTFPFGIIIYLNTL